MNTKTLIAYTLVATVLFAGCSSNTKDTAPDTSSLSSVSQGESQAGQSKISEEADLLEQGLRAFDSQLYSTAFEIFKKFQDSYPTSYYAPLVEIKMADSQYFSGDFDTAITHYEEFIRLRPTHEAVSYAAIQVAHSHMAKYRGIVHDQTPLSNAMQQYEQFLKKYPGSVYANQARQGSKHCKEALQMHEAYVAEFYSKQGLKDAAQHRRDQQTQGVPPLVQSKQ